MSRGRDGLGGRGSYEKAEGVRGQLPRLDAREVE